jgi:hypothetical protein
MVGIARIQAAISLENMNEGRARERAVIKMKK